MTLKDGWIRTGDLGTITYNNCLKILGRIKATIVLSSGENVEPEPIEMRLQQSQYIEHCMLVGQDKRFLSVLIVPSLVEFRQAGFKAQSLSELAKNADVQHLIRKEIKRMTSSPNGFKKYEQIRDFRILEDGFKVGHELTNLFKVKRHVVEKKYSEVIADLFSKETTNN
jgi:long-chain acyl-CoA synthetase